MASRCNLTFTSAYLYISLLCDLQCEGRLDIMVHVFYMFMHLLFISFCVNRSHFLQGERRRQRNGRFSEIQIPKNYEEERYFSTRSAAILSSIKILTSKSIVLGTKEGNKQDRVFPNVWNVEGVSLLRALNNEAPHVYLLIQRKTEMFLINWRLFHLFFSQFSGLQVHQPDGCHPGLSRPPLPSPRRASPYWRSAAASLAPSCRPGAPAAGADTGAHNLEISLSFSPTKTLEHGWSSAVAFWQRERGRNGCRKHHVLIIGSVCLFHWISSPSSHLTAVFFFFTHHGLQKETTQPIMFISCFCRKYVGGQGCTVCTLI